MIYENILNQNNLIELNDRLVIGVSGGPDSMGLLHFLMSLQEKYQLTLYVAHVNHHTREEENTKEEEMIQKFCALYQLPLYVGHFNKRGKKNFHEEARDYRYQYFLQLAKKLEANKIVLAHHEDDQVETILFKIARGNHISGYIGMKKSFMIDDNITIIRPFLNVTKSDILSYCHKYQVPFMIDSSNFKNIYTRNYIRNNIIPTFDEIQSDFSNKIMQLHDQLVEVDDYLKQNSKILLKEMIISCEKDRIILDVSKLKNTHIAIIRYILLSVVNELCEESFELTYEKLKNLINIIHSEKPNITFDLGNQMYCVKAYNKISFEIGQKDYEAYGIIIDDFKDYDLPNGMILRVKKVEEKRKFNNKSLILCYNSTIWPFTVRTRKKGDEIKTKIGTKKVNRIFIDAKIPVNMRKTWPLLVDKQGHVLWVIGIQKPDFSLLPNGEENVMIEVL